MDNPDTDDIDEGVIANFLHGYRRRHVREYIERYIGPDLFAQLEYFTIVLPVACLGMNKADCLDNLLTVYHIYHKESSQYCYPKRVPTTSKTLDKLWLKCGSSDHPKATLEALNQMEALLADTRTKLEIARQREQELNALKAQAPRRTAAQQSITSSDVRDAFSTAASTAVTSATNAADSAAVEAKKLVDDAKDHTKESVESAQTVVSEAAAVATERAEIAATATAERAGSAAASAFGKVRGVLAFTKKR